MNIKATILATSSCCALTLAAAVSASPYPSTDKGDVDSDKVYSPYVGNDYPNEVLFGDVHFHTNLSPKVGPTDLVGE